jgi:hypothetical protein
MVTFYLILRLAIMWYARSCGRTPIENGQIRGQISKRLPETTPDTSLFHLEYRRFDVKKPKTNKSPRTMSTTVKKHVDSGPSKQLLLDVKIHTCFANSLRVHIVRNS